MLFSSLFFIYVFLPVVIILYYISPRRFKNYILLLSSLIFYAWNNFSYLYLLLFVIFNAYVFGLIISLAKSNIIKSCALALGIIIPLDVLAYYKYYNFIIENFNSAFSFPMSTVEILLPIGISFYIFQAISYIIDVSRKEVQPQKNPFKLALYISFFPQLIAGPIIKYRDIAAQISQRSENFDKFCYGVKRFIIGLAKKVLIADTMGSIVDKIFELPVEQFDAGIAWLGAISYTFQIYYDFSGYSDMAIGLGAIFGFKILENFNYPYISKSISEFWRRWHISLGSWFRDYLFYPLSSTLGENSLITGIGSKFGMFYQKLIMLIISLSIVWFATGLWHGANWTFVIWGLYNGFFIFIETISKINRSSKNLYVNIFKHIYAILVIVLSFVIFRADTMTYAANYIKKMFGLVNSQPTQRLFLYYADNTAIIALTVAFVCSTPIFSKILEAKSPLKSGFVNLWLLVLFIVSTAMLAAQTYNPFIYFKF